MSLSTFVTRVKVTISEKHLTNGDNCNHIWNIFSGVVWHAKHSPPGASFPGKSTAAVPKSQREGNMDQPTVLQMRENNRECAMARDLINKKCFAGGDANHRNEALEAWANVAKCEGLLK